MRTLFAYRKLILHLPEPKDLWDGFEEELKAAGVSVGQSKDSISYRAVTFPYGKELLAARVLRHVLGDDKPCRVEIFGGYCDHASEMCTADTFSAVIYRLTEEPCQGVALYHEIEMAKINLGIEIARKKLKQAAITEQAIRLFAAQYGKDPEFSVDGVSREEIADITPQLWIELEKDVKFFLRYLEELEGDCQFHQEYYDTLATDFGEALVTDMRTKLRTNIEVDSPIDLDDEEEYESRKMEQDSYLEDTVAVISGLPRRYNDYCDADDSKDGDIDTPWRDSYVFDDDDDDDEDTESW